MYWTYEWNKDNIIQMLYEHQYYIYFNVEEFQNLSLNQLYIININKYILPFYNIYKMLLKSFEEKCPWHYTINSFEYCK
jgi:hypothetical protein